MEKRRFEELDFIAGTMPVDCPAFTFAYERETWEWGTHSDPRRRTCLRCDVYFLWDAEIEGSAFPVCWSCGKSDKLNRKLLSTLMTTFECVTRDELFTRPPGKLDLHKILSQPPVVQSWMGWMGLREEEAAQAAV